jgi:pilus assembly protein Flp/PilA
MKNTLVRFFRDEEGQGMTEYGLIIALVAIVVIGGLTLLGGNLGTIFNSIAGNIVP